MQREKNLSKERILLLDSVGFIWDPLEQEWQDNYQILVQYVKDHGDANVPQRDPLIGQWTCSQRKARISGRLSEERILLLDSIGFAWDPLEKEWQNNYKLLVQFYKDNGNTKVPINHPTLGSWVSRQRKAKSEDKLPEDRIKLLNKLEFVWDPFEQEWQKHFQLLKEYLKENGDTCVPARYPKLGYWVFSQRNAKTKGKLPLNRIQSLDSIGFIWDP